MKFNFADRILENDCYGLRQTAVPDKVLKNTIEAKPRKSVYASSDKLGIPHTTAVQRLNTIQKVN